MRVSEAEIGSLTLVVGAILALPIPSIPHIFPILGCSEELVGVMMILVGAAKVGAYYAAGTPSRLSRYARNAVRWLGSLFWLSLSLGLFFHDGFEQEGGGTALLFATLAAWVCTFGLRSISQDNIKRAVELRRHVEVCENRP